MIKFRYLLLVLLMFSISVLYGESKVKILNVKGAELSVDEKGNFNSAIIIDIPEEHYIYANPKGPGTGLAVEIIPSIKRDNFRVLYPKGVKYTPSGEKDYVYVYRGSVTIPFSWEGRDSIDISVSALLCSSTSCLPIKENFSIGSVKSSSSDKLDDAKNQFGVSRENKQQDSLEYLNSGVFKQEELSGNFKFNPQYIEKSVTGIFQAIVFGLIAGLILNFMPCVLPVVSLKIMAFVENANEDRRVIALQGILFSGGIVVSFMILAALASFWGYRWGGLFQHRGFLIFMTVFVFSMAMSMFGLFSLNAPSFVGNVAVGKRGKYRDAFVKGVIATLLATPCSGPFLGGTLAWAMTGTPVTIFVVFFSVGLGMALPYMILALRPGFIKYIPSPGPWMEVFEKAMAFLLVFTAVYLLGILGENDRMGTILFLVILCVGLWQYGRFGSIVRSVRSRIVSLFVLVLILFLGYLVSFDYIYAKSEVLAYDKNVFSIERLLENRERGVISVVEFTADWCPNCKLVEKITLENIEVAALIAKPDVDFMVADITRRGSIAEKLLKSLGSESIPFLAMFPAGKTFSDPLCLRDIYNVDDFTKALELIRQGDE